MRSSRTAALGIVPAVVLLVPLYRVILHPPLIGHSLVNLWLPACASAFNVVLITRVFDNLPREVFEARVSTERVRAACSGPWCCR